MIHQYRSSSTLGAFVAPPSLVPRGSTSEDREQTLLNHKNGFSADATDALDPERVTSALEQGMLLSPISTLTDLTNHSLSTFGHSPQAIPLGVDLPTCLCDASSLRILEPLQYAELQPQEAAVDRSLQLLHRGVSVCQSSLTCAACWQSSSSLASLLLMQGVMKCYNSLLASCEEYAPSDDQNKSQVTIGAFQVDKHLQNEVVSAIIKAEMTKAADVLRAYDAALQQNDQSNSRLLQAAKYFSRALKEEFQI